MRWFRRSPRTPDQLDPRVRREVVAFLRDWLPETTLATYRGMMLADPDGWHRDPHFRGGVVVEHLLRGNGLDEAVLGVSDLNGIWADLLREVVLGEASGPSSAREA